VAWWSQWLGQRVAAWAVTEAQVEEVARLREREIGKELSHVYYLIRLITSSLVFIVLMGLDS
jgi:hypothetical protein